MILTEKEKITIATYDRLAPKWAETHVDPSFCAAETTIFQKYLPHGEVFEYGVGGARDGRRLKDLGYGYVGADLSTGMLREAARRNPDLILCHGDVDEIAFATIMDGFWCAATLLHTAKEKIPTILQIVNSVMRKGGIGFVCVKEGEGDLVLDKDDKYGPRYFSYYRQEEFADILENNRFPILQQYVTPVSARTTWLNYFVQAA